MRRESKTGNMARYAISLAIIFISGTLASFGQMSGTYTLGASGNFASFDAAVDSLVKNGVNGPVVINVDSGTYTESVTVHAISGASATNTITFQSVGKDSTTVTLETASIASSGFGGAKLSWALAFSGCDYVTFKWMTIARTGTNVSAIAVKIDSGACHNTITNCILMGAKITKAATGYGATYEEVVYASHSASFDDSFNNISNNFIQYGTYGIYLTYAGGYGSTAGEAGVYDNITNNIIDSAFSNGIYLDYIDSSLISGNTITNIQEAAAAASGFTPAVNPIGIEIVNASVLYVNKNYINMANGGYGIDLGAITSSSRKNSIISNNMIIIGGKSGYGIYIPKPVTGYFGGGTPGDISYGNFYYNSILVTSTGASTTTAGIYFASNNGLNNNNFENNISYNSGGGLAINFAGTVDLNIVDYNDWYSGGADLGGWGGTNYSIANWVSTTVVDSHSVFANPMFSTVRTPLYTTAAACYQSGTPVIVTTDYYGVTRNSSHPCIGANEFRLPANDAGIGTIDSPTGRFCKTTASNVYVSISDFGSATLTSVNVGWSVNGVSQKAVSWTGSIATGQSDMVKIGSYTFASGTSYAIKAWTYTPNGVLDSVPSNDTSLVSGIQQGLSGIYSIGSGGTYSTIKAAISDITNRGMCGPVTFNLVSGSFNEQDSIVAIPGSSAINTVTFQSQSGDSTKVNWNYSTGTTDNYIVQITGASYITFKQITFHSTGNANSTTLVSIANSHHLTFTNNRFIGVYKSTSNSLVDAGIPVAGYFGTLTYPGDADSDLMINNNYFSNNNYSIYLLGTGTGTGEQTNNIISNNTSDSAYANGINLQYQSNTIISHNKITNYGLNAGGYNGEASGISLTNCDNSLQVYSNNVQGTGNKYGIYTSTCAGNGQNEIYNNFVSIAQGATSSGYFPVNPYGIYVTGCSYQDIYFNNVNMYNSNTGGAAFYSTDIAGYFGGGTKNSNITIENNNFVNAGGGYAMYNNSATTSYDSVDYNNIYTSGTNLAYWNTTTYTSLSGYISASYQVNTLSIDPGYTSSTDLHVSNKSLFGKATPISGITTDYDGKKRHAAPTIGAIELSIPYNGAGLTAVDNPTPNGSICGGKTNIMITLKNLGLGTLKSALINWQIDGTTQTAYSFTGSVDFDSATIVSLPYNFTAAGKTTILAWVTSPNGVSVDSVTGNDSVSVSFTVNLPPASLTSDSLGVCAGNSVSPGNTSVNGDTYSWVSIPSGYTSTSANPSLSPTVSTTYILTETNGYSCVTIDTVKVTVNALPVVSITIGMPGANGVVRFTVSDSTQKSYSWSFGDGSTSSDPNVTHTYLSNGKYKVSMTVTNAEGCSITDTGSVLINTTGISIMQTNVSGMVISPNPFTGGFSLAYTLSSSETVTATIYDINGKEIMPLTNGIQGAGQYTLHFEGSALPAGVYILRMIAGASAVNEKIIKVN